MHKGLGGRGDCPAGEDNGESEESHTCTQREDGKTEMMEEKDETRARKHGDKDLRKLDL